MPTDAVNNDTEQLDENQQIAQRRSKLQQWRQQGQAFPNTFRRDQLANELQQQFGDADKASLEATPVTVKVAGRIMGRRLMGKASFVHLQDKSGKIQLYVRKDALGEELYEQFTHWDFGDIVGAQGVLFKTNTGELSLRVSEVELLTKALRPLPEKFHGLPDHEQRSRQRYLDILVNDDSRERFLIRSKTISALREFLTAQDFLEVETPMMHPIVGGATAKPFITYHNTLDMQLYLRIAPELYLKRLVVGGYERVFEINRNFRNEGLSTRHNPEFTMVEFYQAYADYKDLMALTETMMRELSQKVLGTSQITYQGHELDLSKPFEVYTVKGSILAFNEGISEADLDDYDKARAIAESMDIHIMEHYGLGKIQIEIFEKTVETRLIQPTFITEYPTEVSPLARRNNDNPFVTDRFEFFVAGRELANGFSELNDPEDQAERFRAQVKESEAGDEEAMQYDNDYIVALEHGLPPTAGEGIGIDRLVMLFTDTASIRDVILFPHMRAEAK